MKKSREIKSIKNITPSFLTKKEIRSEHQEMVIGVMDFMGEDNYKKICGRLKGYKPNQIYDAIKLCKSKKEPRAYFNAMLKNKWI